MLPPTQPQALTPMESPPLAPAETPPSAPIQPSAPAPTQRPPLVPTERQPLAPIHAPPLAPDEPAPVPAEDPQWPPTPQRLLYVPSGVLKFFTDALDVLSRYTVGGRQAFLTFRAREFRRDSPNGQWHVEGLNFLKPEDVERICGSLTQVQHIADKEFEKLISEGKNLAAGPLGTEWHRRLKNVFEKQKREGFSAEQLIAKDENGKFKEENRGDNPEGSVRLDLRQLKNVKTVCIYDYKSGRKKLSYRRMRDLVEKAGEAHPDATQIIVAQVRPSRVGSIRKRTLRGE